MAGCICPVGQVKSRTMWLVTCWRELELELEVVRHAAPTHLGADIRKDEARVVGVCEKLVCAGVGCGRLDTGGGGGLPG